jgi:hypothetical protein
MITRTEMINDILPDHPTVEQVIKLIETGDFGISISAIEDSECESIWDLEDDEVIEMITNKDLWNTKVNLGVTFINAMKIALCNRVNTEDIIKSELSTYSDVIYQQLRFMDNELLIELYKSIVGEDGYEEKTSQYDTMEEIREQTTARRIGQIESELRTIRSTIKYEPDDIAFSALMLRQENLLKELHILESWG